MTRAMAVAIGMMRRGSRNSPEMCVPTSQPENAHTNRLIAVPTPAQPCGRNGSNRAASIAGKAAVTTNTTMPMSNPVRPNCTHPAMRTPRRLMRNGGTTMARPSSGTAARSMPAIAQMYSPPRRARTGNPATVPK